MAGMYDRNYTDKGYLMKYIQGAKIAPYKNWVLQFRIELAGIQPVIWRCIRVPSDYNFWDLHVAIQDAMGWQDRHLHHFEIKAKGKKARLKIGIPELGPLPRSVDIYPGWEIPVMKYFNELGVAADYLYDYGDSWQHTVLLEGYMLKQKKTAYPVCIGGERACPPENCGGEYGYIHLIKTLSNRDDPDYEMTRLWMGDDWDPGRFDCKKISFSHPFKRWKEAFPTG